MNEQVLKNIESLLARDTNDILADIGKETMNSTQYALPSNGLDLIATGKAFLDYHLNEIRRLLCTNQVVIDLSTNNTDEKSLAIAIADILLATINFAPVAQVSVLIARIGITRLCKNYSCGNDTNN